MPRQRTRYRRVTYIFPEDFALCLERFKEASGLSSSELAHLLGTSPFTVRRWGTGVRPTSQNLMACWSLPTIWGSATCCPRAELGESLSESEDPTQADEGRGSFTTSCRDYSQF